MLGFSAISEGPIGDEGAGAAASITINCTVGDAAAAGRPAVVSSVIVITCTAGVAVAGGAVASIYQGYTIACAVGVAIASGGTASILQGGSFARAPAGDGYRPRQERQGPIRTADIQGYDR